MGNPTLYNIDNMRYFFDNLVGISEGVLHVQNFISNDRKKRRK